MAEQISPDLNFVRDVIASGGESLKKCYQCATCSVVCNVTPDSKPFPRKEMIYAQWGLKDRLFPNPDIWLCHQCSDCTAYCPRGAKPGEVLNAVRKLSIQHYSVPRFLGKAVGSPQYLVLLLAVPVVIFLIILASIGHLSLSNIPRGEDGGISYALFFPALSIDAVFVPAAAFAIFSFVLGISGYWKDMARSAGDKRWKMVLKGGLLSTIIATIGVILSHKQFQKCDLTKDRQVSHFLVFYSFAGLAITTALGFIYVWGPVVMKLLGMKPLGWMLGESPYPLTDPMKIIGNASALALLIGITLGVRNRLRNKEKAGSGSYFDWLFLNIVYLIVATGILAEILRLADIAVLAYPIYFVHLVVVFFLFLYAPFSKMSHMVYRATAMIFARQAEREVEG
ncbi:MAG: quinone-interacting membrane-bound oxidoreductase complex subunit QmoC [Nitrospirota bacterium]